jgi:hypothetical protein
MDSVGEQLVMHRRGPSDSTNTTNSTDLAYLMDTPQLYRTRKTSLEDRDMNTSFMTFQPERRGKARRPPTIDTSLAKPDFETKTILLHPPRSPTAPSLTNSEATTALTATTTSTESTGFSQDGAKNKEKKKKKARIAEDDPRLIDPWALPSWDKPVRTPATKAIKAPAAIAEAPNEQ